MTSTKLHRFGLAKKFGYGLVFGLGVAAISIAMPCLAPLIPVVFLLPFWGSTWAGSCPCCSEYIEVHKKAGGVKCPGCGKSLAIRAGELWDLPGI